MKLKLLFFHGLLYLRSCFINDDDYVLIIKVLQD